MPASLDLTDALALPLVLRVLVDRPENPARFLVLGSASRDLIRQSSETLASRIGYIELTPFSLTETGPASTSALWERGGFPPSYLATRMEASRQWRKDYIATFLERDLPALGIAVPAQSLRQFWMMLAHYHAQLINFSELGRRLIGDPGANFRRLPDPATSLDGNRVTYTSPCYAALSTKSTWIAS